MRAKIEMRTSDLERIQVQNSSIKVPALVTVEIDVEGEKTEIQIGIGADGRVAIRRMDYP